MFAKQFLETKPWEARSQRHQNSSVVFHWAPATSYLLNATGQDQQKRKPCTAFTDGHSLFLAGILCFWWVFWVSNGHSLFLGGILCFWQASQVMLDHLKCRYTEHWSIPSSWQWGGREGNMPHVEWGAWAALGDQLGVSRGKAVGFGSLSVAAGKTLKCGKVVTWWLISPKVWHSSGRVSLLPGSLEWNQAVS